MGPSVGMLALAVKYPSVLRTNDFWRKNYPELIEKVESLGAGKVWTGPKDPKGPSAAFDTAMGPYLSDPFRGTVERRILGPGESSLTLEVDAASMAIKAAGMSVEDVDFLISVSFQPESPGCGNGVYIAHEMGLKCPAINLETCCSGTLVSFQHACALVATGQYRNVMVTVSCTYSIQCEPSGNLSLTSGDGAAAFIVGPVEEGYGFLGGKTINTAETVGAMYFELTVDPPDNTPRIRLANSREGGRILRNSNSSFIETCVRGACEKAEVPLESIDFFVFNTPTAWYTEFSTKLLGIDHSKTINTYPLYANTGPALTTGNLYHALLDKRIKPGDLVLLYSIGSISTASAAVIRWTDCPLGPPPRPATTTQ